ncbi:GNAT family protein [Brevibacillus laterosporus]|uniref:GNAT family N-acetyltransferase n=1 Tax=Brevibacillus laterosporus TaxID=1465 RepID=UPI00035F1B7B|nr:GNAT family protein [Brevibacillus laterosporus]ATO48413.1 alanine acetyltransferase [Brevibacillus laterosporus DSM 25]MBG9803192.1 alanine acetyltransferase [Brevibacillus laterosporus]MED2002122.1 GNAT family protein [Brevibacillus laterosporus]MED4765461.1 GNAT family protein [Brevibacillus laterosporus]TPH11843.1 N-acetyltransferase [Brevibacillus laterosporus]
MNLGKIFEDFPVLESVHFVLKKIEEVHLHEVYKIYDNDKVFKYCGIIPKHNLQTVRKMIDHFDRDYHKKSRIKCGIFQKSECNKLVGIIECMDFNQKVNMVSIGYFLAEEYWRKGIATESIGELVKFLFEEADVNRIQAEIMPANQISKKVILKNGFIKEGLLRQASLWSGKGVVDLEIYGLLKEDYTNNIYISNE